MLISVQMLNYGGNGCVVSIEEAVINNDYIMVIAPVRTERREPCVRITMDDGNYLECLGRPRDFLKKESTNA